MDRVIIAHRQQRCFGILVDNVVGVVTFSRKELSVPDDLLRQTGTIHAVAKMKDRMIPLLDLYSLLNQNEDLRLPGGSDDTCTTTGSVQPGEVLMETLEQG